jgi:hypothetical protein
LAFGQPLGIRSQNLRQIGEVANILLINELLAPFDCLSSLIHRKLDIFILLNAFGGIIKHSVLDDVAAELKVFLRCIVCYFRDDFLIFLNELG